jgi:DNA-binding MarR family transcriptional regulator
MALMLSVYLGDGPHTVRGLAQSLRVSKPAVSRALDRLGELGYVRRQRDDLDRRNVLVQRTGNGAQFLTAFSQLVDDAKAFVSGLPSRTVEFGVESAVPTAYEQRSWAIEAAE